MGFKTGLAYEPLPLPDRMDFTDDAVMKGASAFYGRMATRHTIRDFSDRPVDKSVVTALIETAGKAPSGANHQPWHFAAINSPEMKSKIRKAAEEEEEKFYGGGAPDEWISALEPIGTGVNKPHLEDAPWLVVVFAERFGVNEDGEKYKNYYVTESVGLAAGFFIAAAHHAGLYCLTHTPSPMGFLTEICERPVHEKPLMVIALGHAHADCTIPRAAKLKKRLDKISSWF